MLDERVKGLKESKFFKERKELYNCLSKVYFSFYNCKICLV